MAVAAILKHRKSSHLNKDLTELYKIWYNDACWPSWPCWPSKLWNFKNPRWLRSLFWKNGNYASFSHHYHCTLSILLNKTANIIRQNWNQLLLVVKATALKPQISKFYSQILDTEASFYIYDSPVTDVWSLASATIQPFGRNTPTSHTDSTGQDMTGQDRQTDRQRSDSIRRTVLQTVAQKHHLSMSEFLSPYTSLNRSSMIMMVTAVIWSALNDWHINVIASVCD